MINGRRSICVHLHTTEEHTGVFGSVHKQVFQFGFFCIKTAFFPPGTWKIDSFHIICLWETEQKIKKTAHVNTMHPSRTTQKCLTLIAC